MITRDNIINYINGYLNSANVKDSSQNGLQVEGKEKINKIVFGVSANMELFKKAKAAGADMVVVHHGLFWSHGPLITGLFKRRVEFLIKNDLNLAAWHLPLDMHPVVGNNAQIAKALGLKKITPYGNYHGTDIGVYGTLAKLKTLAEIEKTLGLKANTKLAFGKAKISTVGIVSGGGYSMFEQFANRGADLFITGSSEEYVQEISRECKINYMAVGHYNSETYGVKALMKEVARKFGVKVEFIDVSNPL
ncbi:dinuclear metal center YbgI/SA1388 family protein [Elusimicrobium simillimum]|uniref:Nif3-like dinuclear metal center hexameric protein n=1 Tax=Elusimicrobium simillimum TaxID=3143438 RepID=UPI003C6FC769